MSKFITALAVSAVVFVGVSSAATWSDTYSDATKEARRQDKPILVCFRTVEAAKATAPQPAAVSANLLDRFVVLYADKNTTAGAAIYKLFDMKSDFGVVVVGKDLKWEFCRYERALDSTEMETLLRETANAEGKPATAQLASIPAVKPARVANYIEPNATPVSQRTVEPTGSTGQQVVQPAAPEQYYYQPTFGGSTCPNCVRRAW